MRFIQPIRMVTRLFDADELPRHQSDNIDYNLLKREIKAHTTRDQGRSIAIPGQEKERLARFESKLFAELCRQHSRLGLFVATKSGELGRKLGTSL